MSKQPSHFAYVVIEPKEGSDRKAFWHRVGTVWPHKNGNGFDLVIPEGLSVSGRVVCTEPKDQDAAQVWWAYNSTKTPEAFMESLKEKSLQLARVTAEDAARSEPEFWTAKRYGRYSPILREGEYVAVSDQGQAYRLAVIEHASLAAAAQTAGLTKGGYIRALVLGCPGPRSQRAPSINAVALAQATAALNKAGSNLNQIARVLNAGAATITAGECRAVMEDVRHAVAGILDIVGRGARR